MLTFSPRTQIVVDMIEVLLSMTKPFNNGYIRQNLTLVSVNVHICPLKISNFDSSNYYVISGDYSYAN